VADSDPASEFQESMNKAQALLRAVEMARGGGQQVSDRVVRP
jgi:anthranilate/para-aminobenzoate synthase component I